jgi:hypothetical protein
MRRVVVAFLSLIVVSSFALVLVLARPSARATQPANAATTAATTVGENTTGTLADLAPVTTPEQLPGPCLNHTMTLDTVPYTIDLLAETTPTIVVGTIDALGPASWNTDAGQAPVKPYVDATRVMRLARVSVDQVVAGDLSTSSPIVWLAGGTIGCHNFTISGIPGDLSAGQRYLLFLNATAPRTGIPGLLHVAHMWAVNGAGSVSTDADGQVDLSDVVARIKAAGPSGSWTMPPTGRPS